MQWPSEKGRKDKHYTENQRKAWRYQSGNQKP